MKNILHLLITFLVLFSVSAKVNAQITIQNNSADIDQDGIPDSLCYKHADYTLVISLSSRKGEVLEIAYVSGDSSFSENVRAVDGGILISKTDVNKSDYYYKYIPDSQRFRLANVSVTDDSQHICGIWTLDLWEGEFKASITFDPRSSNPESHDIRSRVSNDPVWLDEPTEYLLPGYEFFEEWRESYTPAYSDTLIYIGLNMDYDIEMLIGCKQGEGREFLGSGNVQPNKGDLISVHIGTDSYQPAGDMMSLQVYDFVYKVEILQPGKLTRFYETNRKEITYEGTHLDYWRYEERCPIDVDYFLATTTEPSIINYLTEPGVLRVVFSDPEEGERDYNIKAELYNVNGEDQTFISRLMMKHTDVFTDYFLWNDVKEIYELILSDYSIE